VEEAWWEAVASNNHIPVAALAEDIDHKLVEGSNLEVQLKASDNLHSKVREASEGEVVEHTPPGEGAAWEEAG
jgi:hypothetical protein